MKRTNFILSALFLLLSAGQLWAQEKLPYKAKAAFNRDTLQYLEHNFAKRNAQYKGKTVGEVIRDLEYPVIYIAKYGVSEKSQESSVFVLRSICLVIKQVGKEPSELKDYYVVINLENPPMLDDFNRVSGDNGDNYYVPITPKLYDFIKDLRVGRVFPNSHILKDPEVKKARKQELLKGFEKILEDSRRDGISEKDLTPMKDHIELIKRDMEK